MNEMEKELWQYNKVRLLGKFFFKRTEKGCIFLYSFAFLIFSASIWRIEGNREIFVIKRVKATC